MIRPKKQRLRKLLLVFSQRRRLAWLCRAGLARLGMHATRTPVAANEAGKPVAKCAPPSSLHSLPCGPCPPLRRRPPRAVTSTRSRLFSATVATAFPVSRGASAITATSVPATRPRLLAARAAQCATPRSSSAPRGATAGRWAPPPSAPFFPSDASCRRFCTPRFVELLLPVRDALTLLPVPRFALLQCKSTFFFKESCGGCEVCIMG